MSNLYWYLIVKRMYLIKVKRTSQKFIDKSYNFFFFFWMAYESYEK